MRGAETLLTEAAVAKQKSPLMKQWTDMNENLILCYQYAIVGLLGRQRNL